jgi:hypothetical protein
MVTEFGVPSSLGSAHRGPLGRDQGDHSEREAMAIDAELLRLIQHVGMAGGMLFSWSDEWFKFSWNTVAHQSPADRRPLWHDPLTNEQHFGLVATDPAGPPDNPRLDEAYLYLSFRLPDPAPATVTIGLDVLPRLTGAPPPGSNDRAADAALELDLSTRTGQAWLRQELDPLPLDYAVPPGLRPEPVDGWQRFQLVLSRDLVIPTTGQKLPAELFDAGVLRYGSWDPQDPKSDSRALWRVDGSTLAVRVPWALAGFGDPSSRRVLMPIDGAATTVESPGVRATVSAAGVTPAEQQITWEPWQRVYYTERLKSGAREFRDALVELG